MNVSNCSRNILRSTVRRNFYLSTTSMLPKVRYPNCHLTLVSNSLCPPSSTTRIEIRGLKYDFDAKKPEIEDETEFDEVASRLALDLTNVFLNRLTIDLYHPDIEIEDKIRGQQFKGLIFYIKNMHLLKILAHLKFVYVRPQIVKLTKHSEERRIVVEWRFVGLTMTRMAIRYIPDRLWNRAIMDHAAKTWYEGVSTFYLDEDLKIVKHIIEKNDAENKDQTLQEMRASVSQKYKI